jgi:predicted kinase
MFKMNRSPLLILVTGLPCTGKTTISQQIADYFQIPLISKDSIKEILFDTLNEGDRDWSRKLSTATYEIMFSILESFISCGVPLIMEANFQPDQTRTVFQNIRQTYLFDTFEVHCITEATVLLRRFLARGKAGERHRGHLDQVVYHEMQALVTSGEYWALNLGGGFYKVNTTDFRTLDMDEIISSIEVYHRSLIGNESHHTSLNI